MRTVVSVGLIVGLAVALIVGCVDQGAGPPPKRVDPGYVPKHLLSAPPVISERLDVQLGGKVVYLGNTVDSAGMIPGQPIRIKHYWKVLAPVGPGWQVFALMRGQPNHADFMNLPATEMQRAHGPATWAAGEIIEDEQEIVLRPDWKSADATLLVGLIAVGEHHVGDRMAATGPRVRDRAVVARVFQVDLSKAPPPPGTVHVPYAQGEIVIDGTTSEAAWSGVAQSPELATAEGSPEPTGKALARMTWDDLHLYLSITVTDTDIFSEFKAQDDPLWKADCVELFIDADQNRRGYVELQVNPNNATFDSWFPQGRAAKGDEAWDSGMMTAVRVRGTADKAGDADQGWDVEIAIPWAAVKGREETMQVRLPPQVGDRWRMNVVRVDKRSGSTNNSASSWNRLSYSDWHGLDRMLTIVFADTRGGVVPGSVPSPTDVLEPGSGSGSDVEAPPAILKQGAGSATPPSQPTPDLGKRPPGAGSGPGSGPGSGSGAVPDPTAEGLRTLRPRDNPPPAPPPTTTKPAPIPKAGSATPAP